MKSRDVILTALNILVYYITRFIYFRLSRYKIVIFSDREKTENHCRAYIFTLLFFLLLLY